MSFGKRTSENGAPQGEIDAAASVRPPSPLRGQVTRLGLGVAIGVTVIAVATLCLNPLMGRGLAKRFEQHPADALITNMALSEALARSCPRPVLRPTIPERRFEESYAIRASILADIHAAKQLAAFLTCTMRHERQRLCAGSERTSLVTGIKSYLRLRQQAIDALAATMHLRSIDFERRYEAELDAHGSHADVLDKASRRGIPAYFREFHEVMVVDPALVRGLRELIGDGYLSLGDLSGFLGFFLPEPLIPHLQDIAVLQTPCR